MSLHQLRCRSLSRILAGSVVAWLVLVAVPSHRSVRSLLATPLYRHHPDASGELAYVMAGGDAYLERLQAASDLYHRRRIQSVYILEEKASGSFDYRTGQPQSKAEWATRYLEFFGVPRHAVQFIDEPATAWMSSLSEAEALSRSLPGDVQQVVVVTSAPHTRRSLLCFERSLPPNVRSSVYAATPPEDSAELSSPLWIEYLKTVIYFLMA